LSTGASREAPVDNGRFALLSWFTKVGLGKSRQVGDDGKSWFAKVGLGKSRQVGDDGKFGLQR